MNNSVAGRRKSSTIPITHVKHAPSCSLSDVVNVMRMVESSNVRAREEVRGIRRVVVMDEAVVRVGMREGKPRRYFTCSSRTSPRTSRCSHSFKDIHSRFGSTSGDGRNLRDLSNAT